VGWTNQENSPPSPFWVQTFPSFSSFGVLFPLVEGCKDKESIDEKRKPHDFPLFSSGFFFFFFFLSLRRYCRELKAKEVSAGADLLFFFFFISPPFLLTPGTSCGQEYCAYAWALRPWLLSSLFSSLRNFFLSWPLRHRASPWCHSKIK